MQQRHNFKLIADNQSGIYQGRTCCVIGANGAFLAANKDALRRLAEANIEIHEYAWKNPDEVAAWYIDALKPAGLTLPDLVAIMSNLKNHIHPIGQDLTDEVRIESEYLRFVDVLDSSIDPAEFAKRITVNLLA
jgi:NitT/TauT family transport system substrate-binding protein